MKKHGILSAFLSFTMVCASLGSFLTTPLNAAANPDVVKPSISEAIPSEDVLGGEGAFNSSSVKSRWTTNYTGQTIDYVTDSNGGCLRFGGNFLNYQSFIYKPTKTVAAGKYKITGYFRTAKPGVCTHLRFSCKDTAGNTYTYWVIPSNEWLKAEFYVNLESNLSSITLSGGTSTLDVQSYYLDNVSLVPVSSIPSDAPTTVGSWNNGLTPQENYELDRGLLDDLDFKPYDAKENSKYKKIGITINDDAESYGLGHVGRTEQEIRSDAESLVGTHVTDYVFCVNNRNATYNSETIGDLAEKYLTTEEGGIAVDYSDNKYLESAYKQFVESDIDPFAVIIDELPKHNINPWISIRMNDGHGNEGDGRWLLSKAYFDHPEWRRVRYDSLFPTTLGFWISATNVFNYGLEEVREYFLAFIEETLNRYNMYGLELDFLRSITFWAYGDEYNGLEYMNDFMRDVNALVAEASLKHGHDIKIAVIVATELERNFELGLDVMTWVSEGIVDRVIPKAYWSTTHNDIPIKLWKSLLDPYGVELCAGIECNLDTYGAQLSRPQSIETIQAVSASYLSQGADNIYLYNYCGAIGRDYTDDEKISTQDPRLGITTDMGYWNMITTIGSYEKLMLTNRRMILTYVDVYTYWGGKNNILSRTIAGGASDSIRVPMGDVYEGSEVYFKISVPEACTALTKIPDVKVNGYNATYVGIEYDKLGLVTDPILIYKVPEECYDDMYIKADITAKAQTIIRYAEVYVDGTNAVEPEI